MTLPKLSAAEIEERIVTYFDANYETLRVEAGHPLRPELKEAARNQVLMYWRRLREIAERVTDTEVPLYLPQRRTPKGREYSIEGVVDVVREADKTMIYDIKAQDQEAVGAAREKYADQLNVYAHIWKHLRGQAVDAVAVIATALPPELADALAERDEVRAGAALAKWDPVVDVPIDEATVEATIDRFARVIDDIEDGVFSAPSAARLEQIEKGIGRGREKFGSRICRFCDARFSCSAYREFVAKQGKRFERKAMGAYSEEEFSPEELAIERTAGAGAVGRQRDD